MDTNDFNFDINISELYQNSYRPTDKHSSADTFNNTGNMKLNKAGVRVDNSRLALNTETFRQISIILVGLNQLTSVSNENCPIKRPEADMDEATNLIINSTTKSCFCQQIYSIITTSSSGTNTLFRFLKPMFLGKVLYR